jgi:hypothetical protein
VCLFLLLFKSKAKLFFLLCHPDCSVGISYIRQLTLFETVNEFISLFDTKASKEAGLLSMQPPLRKRVAPATEGLFS